MSLSLYELLSPLSRALTFHVFISFNMTSIERTTKKGLHSVWHFVQAPDACYAFGGCHKPLIKKFAAIEDMRAFYKQMLGYGYSPQMTQLELSL